MAAMGKWLLPGMRIKRWLLLAVVGVILVTLGFVYLLRDRDIFDAEAWVRTETGWNVPPYGLELACMVVGVTAIVFGIRGWFQSIYHALVPFESKQLVEVVYERHFSPGVKVVVVGGGTGLSSLLRGLKAETSNITAVVSVSDDGGSSGRLRKELGVLPPGDIRNCLVALADDESLLSELFQYRFAEGDDIGGHSFGNLFLAALTGVAGGDFDQAVKLTSKILAIRGRVLPATLDTSTLCAEYEDGTIICGESEIPRQRQKLKRVMLMPDNCSPQPDVLAALREADLIILGPGSLYTSVLPNLLVRGVADGIRQSRAVKIYVCNVMTQPGETDGFKASDHVMALVDHLGDPLVDFALLNDEVPQRLLRKYEAEGAYPVLADVEDVQKLGVECILASLISETNLVRHDPQKLAEAIHHIVEEKCHPAEGFLRLLDKPLRVA
jgi:uncharacterized cofD-like protein